MKPNTIGRQALAQLRHQLRTPLNHIIGYSEILIEDSANRPPDVLRLLTSVHAAARQILDLVQQALSPRIVKDDQLQALRDAMQGPVQAMMLEIGVLVQKGEPADLLDLLRINSAASELLAFALGQMPKAAAEARVAEVREAAPPLSAAVLLVDDDESNRDILSRQLERTGCSVMAVEDGAAAIASVGRRKFDLILLDIVMPGLDGISTLERLQQSPEAPPVVMISALDEMDSVRTCLELGAEDYLLKPFDPILLRSRLAATLERSRLRSISRDRTRELEAALSQVQQVNEDLQQFAYAVSHDLQSPIRTVTTMSQLLARRFTGKIDPDTDQLLKNITDSMKRMHELVSDLLTYSHLNRKQEEPQSEFPLEDAVRLALQNLEEQIHATSAKIEFTGLPSVAGRRTQFVQVFQNLIGNSLKYRGADPPHVRVTAELGPAACIVHVADNGLGFDPAYASQIFEPFKRLHSYEYPGSGIGLAICARIILQNGGSIWAESEPGKGSTFSFSLPATACRPIANRAGTGSTD